MRASRNLPLFAVGVLIAVIAAVLVAAAFRFIPAAAANAPAATVAGAGGPRDTVTVIGEGTQHAAPDTAIINLGVNAKRPSARDSLTVASTEITRLVNAIKAQGVLDADIQTTSLLSARTTTAAAMSAATRPRTRSRSGFITSPT